MPLETIGYSPKEVANMPEIRQKIVEAKFAPRLNNYDRRLSLLNQGQLDFIASILS